MRIRLRYKLFLVILFANALLTAVIVIANNRAFNTGFDNYLGEVQARRLAPLVDRLFAEQQRRQLRWIALVALGLSAAIAIPFAGALVRPITRLQKATHQLAGGHYDVTLPDRGSDELAELARDFNQLAHTLAQNLDARQRWIADISHELRTPIAVLRAELEALQDGVRQPDAETLQSLHQEITRLGGLVADLHELSLSDSGALSYQRTPVDLAEVIDTVLGHCQAGLTRSGLAVSLERPDTAVVIEGDRNRLTQLVTNLLHNSLAYTDSSPETPGRLNIRLWRDKRGTHLLWSDSAPGVPTDALPHLFERLYRVEGSRSRATGGSGLGLAIVRNVVEAHRGSIEARPSVLGGLTLAITLPNPEKQ